MFFHNLYIFIGFQLSWRRSIEFTTLWGGLSRLIHLRPTDKGDWRIWQTILTQCEYNKQHEEEHKEISFYRAIILVTLLYVVGYLPVPSMTLQMLPPALASELSLTSTEVTKFLKSWRSPALRPCYGCFNYAELNKSQEWGIFPDPDHSVQQALDWPLWQMATKTIQGLVENYFGASHIDHHW